jgi:hypothetical protein
MIPMVLPGFHGLNKQQSSGILGPEWATRLENAVIDDNSRVAARNGWATSTSTPAAQPFVQIHAYWKADGTQYLIASGATALYSSSNDGSSWSDVTNSIVFTAGNWQFVNFNDICYGVQQGEVLIYGTGGNFTQSAAVNAPSGNCILSAFGRLWAADSDGTTLRYCALLNGGDWNGSDAGVFDLTNVWSGSDTIVALAEFNGALVVFGKYNIVFFSDNAGSALGMDPTQMYVVDIVSGTGCIARDSVRNVDGDLWFLSANGLQSLSRVVQEKSNPLSNLSSNVQDYLLGLWDTFTLSNLRSAYSPKDRFYLLSFPNGSGGGEAIVFDTRGRLPGGSARCMGTWTLAPGAMTVDKNFVLYMALDDVAGEIGEYSGALDDGADYTFAYESGWMDLTQQGYLLFPKRFSGVFFSDTTISVNFRWAFDFNTGFKSRAKSFSATSASEYNIAEYNIGEYGGGVSLQSGNVNSSGSGEYIKLGITVDISSTTFAVQQLDLFCKVGRYA